MGNRQLMSWMCGALLVTGCGETQPDGSRAVQAEASGGKTVRVEANVQVRAKLSGQVSYLERSALPADAVLEVKLLDVSLADAPAKVLASQRLAPGQQVPIDFTLLYEPRQIIASHSYALQARVLQGNRLLFINTQRYPVLTRGAPSDDIAIRVNPVVH